MNIYFGENLKQLRHRRNLTQETLANFLGVSFQTISKWEHGDTYPDITMLPQIAAYFGVSVDALLGFNKAEDEQRINEYIKLYDTMHFKNTAELFRKFKNAVKDFPADFRILIRYMELLEEEKDHPYNPGIIKNPDYEKTSHELMSIYENIQNHCTDDDIRIWSRRIIIAHLMKKFDFSFDEKTGKWKCDKESLKKAEDILSTMPSLCNAKEYLAISVCDHKKRDDTVSAAVEELSYLLQNTIISYCYYDDRFTPEYKINIIKHMNGIFEMTEQNTYYSKNRINLIYNYGHLGHLYFETGDIKKAIEYLRLSAEYAKDLDNHPSEAERISRFYETEKIFKEMSISERIKLLMTEHYHLTEDFKGQEEFKAIIALLES